MMVQEPTSASVDALRELRAAPRLTPSAAWMVCALVALGSLALLPVWASGWRLWSTDSLRSIGAFFPVLGFAGTVAAWRRTGWRFAGTWWGLLLALFAMGVATMFSSDSLRMFMFHREVHLLHPGMAMLLYGVGAALLFGGPRLVKLAAAPLCLLLLLNPVPQSFQSLIDMPLQILSAGTARAFAHLIGLQPTGVQLRMMFTPSFGMMIVPGCSGLRGAVTLGYLALIYGYVRRLRLLPLAMLAVGGVLLGYVLNLLRLCLLVCYYRVGVSMPSIQSYGTQVDYVIGVSLFLAATVAIGWTAGVILTRLGGQRVERANVAQQPSTVASAWKPRASALGLAALAIFIPQQRSVAVHHRPQISGEELVGALPQVVGSFTRARTWEEKDSAGKLMFVWSEYRGEGTADPIILGVYLGEDHLVSMSKMAQGIKPEWSGTLQASRAQGTPIRFLTNFYSDAGTRTMDVETSCRGDLCELQGAIPVARSFSLVTPHLSDLFIESTERRVPLLLRGEWKPGQATGMSPQDLRAQFTAEVQTFVAALDLRPLLAVEQGRADF